MQAKVEGEKAQRAPTAPDRATRGAASSPAALLYDRLGHRTFTDLTERAEEAQATRIADAIEPGGADQVRPGPASDERASLGAVRVHRDAAAERATAAQGAVALTRGNDISLASRAPRLDSHGGRWLLAHELAHAAQQQGGPPRVRLYRDPAGGFHNPDKDVVSDVPGALPVDVMDPTSGIDVDETVSVAAPLLAFQHPRPEDRRQIYHLHSAVIKRTAIAAYAISRKLLSLDPEGKQPVSATPFQPILNPGDTVYGPDHQPLPVLSADATTVVVDSTKAIHYAVGAGSSLLVHTNSGKYMFDAGININEPHALADAIVDKIVAELNGEAIRVIFLTHAHYDHFSLMKRLARRVQIDAIVVNPLQFTREEYQKLREEMRKADAERRAEAKEQLEKDPKARQDFIDSLEQETSQEAINPKDVDAEWSKKVETTINERFPEMHEFNALPTQGSSGLEFETVGTSTLHGGTPSIRLEDVLPSGQDVDFRGVVDPSMYGRRTLAEGDVDRMSTTFIVTIDGQRRLVIPDLRRVDLKEIRAKLRETVQGRDVEFQEWTAGHHMQVGWTDVETVSSKTLRETLELLHDFRAAGSQGHPGRDVVITSVDAPKVSEAQVRLLKLIGFETYLAESNVDIETYEVYSGGRRFRAVRGPLAPGAKGEPTLRRSIAGRRLLEGKKNDLKVQRNHTRGRAEKAELKRQIVDLDTRIRNIKQLENAVIDAARRKPYNEEQARHTEQVLNDTLDAQPEHIGRVVTSSSQLTDTALVIMNQPLGPEPTVGTPEAARRARLLELREQKSRVDLLRKKANAATTPEERAEAFTDLYAENLQYEKLLQDEKAAHDPGVSSEIIENELKGLADEQKTFKQHSVGTEAARLPDGQLVKTEVVKVTAPDVDVRGAPRGPSKTAQAMMRGLDVVGRGMGGVMVISTIRGSADLIKRYEDGQANMPQLALGATRELTSGWVGLRMLRGKSVGTGVFVIMSALEIAEAASGDYESDTQRRRAVDAAVRNGAINTGCMLVGEVLMETMNPFGIAAGAIIMFAGPFILGLLFGDKAPEQLYPDEIGVVDDDLVKLVAEYEAVIGGLHAERRDPAARKDIGLDANISPDAQASVEKHRMRALYLEQQILTAFDAAYGKAKEGRAGLRELDEMRRKFLSLRARASTDQTDEEARQAINDLVGAGSRALADEPVIPYGFQLPIEYDASGRPIPIREQTLRRLQAMEASLSLDALTPQQIRDMDQWESIRKSATDLGIQVLRDQALDPDWADIAQRQHDLEARLASARYRLEPKAQFDPQNIARHQPLLSPGTDARRTYEQELKKAEDQVASAERLVLRAHWLNFRAEGVETDIKALSKNAQFDSYFERHVAIVEDAVRLYKQTIEEIKEPPRAAGTAEELYRDPGARARYKSQLDTNKPYRKLLRRLEITEVSARSLLRSTAAELAALTPGTPKVDPAKLKARLDHASERFRTLQNDRKVVRAILYSYEVDEIASREHDVAMAYYGPKLASRRDEQPLTREERVAFATGDYGAVGTGLLERPRSIADRLVLVRGLRAPTGPTEVTLPSGETIRAIRNLDNIMLLDALTSEDKLLVGIVAEVPYSDMVSVVPLNDEAANILGGYGTLVVDASRLTQATEEDLPE